MADIQPSKGIDIKKELKDLSLLKYHPNAILNKSLNRLKDMLDGKVQIVDPSNPFIYLLETSSLNTAFAIQEHTLLTRKLYPRLANCEEDLYLHMSDYDYQGRFAEPAYTDVHFNILLNDFKEKANYDPALKDHVLKIPRNSKITIDDYVFLLPTAVIIRLTESGIMDVKFDTKYSDSMFIQGTNFINFNNFKVDNDENYLSFTLRLPEVDVEAIEVPVEKSKLFKNEITYNPKREYYYFKAYHMKDGVWHEMLVTHTEQVYDIDTPTCVVKVLKDSKKVEYFIPPVYVNGNKIGSKVKFVLYTTKGPVNVNFSEYLVSDFNLEYGDIFPDLELDADTSPLQLINKVVFIQDTVVGGKGPLSFEELKHNVINNSVGDRSLPITNKQLEFFTTQNNFRIIKDVDVVTNRTFLLECPIPNPVSRYILTKFNLDIIEYKTSIEELTIGKNNITKVSDEIVIIAEGTIFKITKNGLYLLDTLEAERLKSLSDSTLTMEVNANSYVSTFYHYVLDTSGNRAELRGYDISHSEVKRINFKSYNPTTRVGINSTVTNLYKVDEGFRLDVLTNFKKYSEELDATNITPYLVYSDGDKSKFFLEGTLVAQSDTTPAYRFELDSNYHIDKNNSIRIKNFKDSSGNLIELNLGLESKIELIFLTDYIPQGFVNGELDRYIQGTYLAISSAVISLEELDVYFGVYLERLFTRIHTSVGLDQYATYPSDVPMRHTHDVYNNSNEIVHFKNEVVLDDDGEEVIQFNKGDFILDENDKPIVVEQSNLERYFNLMLVDHKLVLANNKEVVEYKELVRDYITDKIVQGANDIQSQLLENTEAFVVVPKSLDYVTVKRDGGITTIPSNQTLDVEVFVNERVYSDREVRDDISQIVVKVTDDYLYSSTTLKKTELLEKLYTDLKEFVESVSISKFTEINSEYLELLDNNGRLSIKKRLVVEPGGYNLVDDINITFHLV